MKRALLLLAACSKKDAPPPPAPSPPLVTARDAAVDAAAIDAALAEIELIHYAKTSITVSSLVANPAIKADDLVDRDLQTAWNSATGRAEGAWIALSFPAGTKPRELRMTAGHTGRGKKGEDYFTMNPRIRAISIWSGQKRVSRATLDITRRDLQPIALPPAEHLTITIDAVVPGSKPTWREACISELEVWGTTPVKRDNFPTVAVATPDSCADLDDELRAYRAKSHSGLDDPGEPRCDDVPIDIGSEEPWDHARLFCPTFDSIYGPRKCTLEVGTTLGTTTIDMSDHAGAHWELEMIGHAVEDVVPGGGPELVLEYHATDRDDTQLVVCTPSPIACTAPLTIAGDGWSTRPRFSLGAVFLDPGKGTPPVSALGRHEIHFD